MATVLLAFTSPAHTLLWDGIELITYDGTTTYDVDYGTWFWVHMTYSYTLNVAAAVMILWAAFLSPRFLFRQRAGLVVALVLPWIANAAYIFRLGGFPLDLSPIAIAIAGMVLVLLVFRYGLGEIVPVVRQRVINDMHDAMLVTDGALRVIDFNRALRRLLPGPIESGMSARALLSDHPKLLTLLERQQESVDVIYTGFGDRVHRISSEILHTEDDLVARLILARDISRDSKIEDALRVVMEGTSEYLGEDFFRSLARSLSLALATDVAMVAETSADGNGRTLAYWCDGAFRENFDYDLNVAPCGTLVARGTSQFPDNVAGLFPQDRRLGELGVEAYLGTPLVDHEGRVIGVLAVMHRQPFPFGEEGQSLIEIFAMRAATEIERRSNERRIHESEASYRRILETTRDGVCVVGPGGLVEYANERLARLFDVPVDQLTGSPLADQVRVPEAVRPALLAADDGTSEFSLVTRTGAERWVSMTKTVIRGDDGVTSGVLYVFSDNTERHFLALKNRGIEEQLQHAQKLESLGVLAGGVAHDFNNLLTPILGYLELIRQRTADDPVVVGYLERMEKASGKLADLCNQMLTYSGKGHFTRSSVDINQVIADLADFARASVPRQFQLHFMTAEEVPLVRADRTQVNQVIMNLLMNASEAMAETAGGDITVTTGQCVLAEEGEGTDFHPSDEFAPGEHVFIRVRDQGMGIDAEDYSRLFEPFYTTKFTGRGLGMAVVYGIVRAHGGAVGVASDPGEGAEVTIYLPVDPMARHVRELTPAESAQTAGGTVLLVDDEKYVRELMRGMLENLGWGVLEAVDGESGFAAFETNETLIRACVIDLTMPGIGGLALLRMIHERSPGLPVLLVSGYSQQSLSAREMDEAGFLQKPFTLTQLDEALRARFQASA